MQFDPESLLADGEQIGADTAVAFCHFDQHEEGAAAQNRADQIVDGRSGEQGAGETEGGEQGAGGDNDQKRRQPVQRLAAEDAQGAAEHGGQTAVEQPVATERCRCRAAAFLKEYAQTQQHIDADLGQDGKNRTDWRDGVSIGCGQPEIEWPGGGLGQEHHAEQGGGAVEEGAVCGR